MPNLKKGKDKYILALLANGSQGSAPGDDLIDYGIQARFMPLRRFENAVVLEVGKKRQHYLSPDVRHHQLAHH